MHPIPAEPNARPSARALRAAVFLLALSLPAHAYIDPASGMLLLQGLLAVIAGFIAFVKNPIATIRSWIARWRKPAEVKDTESKPPQP